MVLNPFPTKGAVQTQADWVEFACLSDSFDHIPVADILSAIDIQADSQDENIAREDGAGEAIVDRVLNEISERARCLQSSYPFRIENGGAVISLVDDFSNLSTDQLVYIYCLIFSHVTKSPILTVSVDPSNADREIMQICATIAAAGYVRGHSIAFGFPRPDDSGFYDKATEVLALLREGELHLKADVNPLHSLSPKDGGIDVISWEEMPDNLAGRRILFSQVASGHNWKEKPVRPFIEIFQTYWLKRQMLSTVSDAIFIPFDMVDDIDNRYTATDLFNSHLKNLGAIFYRKRIPIMFKIGMDLARQNATLHIENLPDFHRITDYVNGRVHELKAVAA